MKTLARHPQSALTQTELLVVLALVGILAALLLPAVWQAGPRCRVNCVSNLKQIGLGWVTWMHDHESGDLPFRTSVANEGTRGSVEPLRNNAWWQYSSISNELDSPKILVCPEAKNVGLSRRVAYVWSATDTNGGYMAPGFRSRATSYAIGLDATKPQGELAGRESGGRVLGTDRNILFDGRSDTCSSGISGTRMVRVKGKNGQNPPAAAAWTNAIHGLWGNILSLDGSVQRTTTRELDALLDLSDDNGSIHFLVPN